MKYIIITILLLSITSVAYSADFVLVDSNATDETQALANDLSSAMATTSSFLYGQQINPAQSEETNTVSTFAITQSYPYVWGDEYLNMKDSRKKAMITHAENGGIITISWHMNNVVTGGDKRDLTGDPVVNIITGGTHVAQYQATLDSFATWLSGFTKADGTKIPVIFRPFHENDGDFFWWGTSTCTEAQYEQLWSETVNYLTASGVNNLIYCYSPLHDNSEANDRYPGNNYVDICGIDAYNDNPDAVAADLSKYQETYDLANANNKIFAICEGLKELDNYPDNDFWTTTADSLLADSKTQTAAYVSFWTDERWSPNISRSTEAADFAQAVADGKFLMVEYNERIRLNKVTISGNVRFD